MLSKRFIGVVTVKNGWAVQSFGYRRYLPLGNPIHIVENLDRWGADEILIQEIDRSSQQLGPNIALLESIAQRGITTPITYAGGIHTKEQAVAVIRAGVERICLETALHHYPENIPSMAAALGSQAIVASLPLVMDDQQACACYYYNAQKQDHKINPISDAMVYLLNDGNISELVIIDARHEGTDQHFDFSLLAATKKLSIPLILFGGLQTIDMIKKALLLDNIAAIGMGNYLNYQEHGVQHVKQQLLDMPLRPPTYQPYEHDKKICL